MLYLLLGIVGAAIVASLSLGVAAGFLAVLLWVGLLLSVIFEGRDPVRDGYWAAKAAGDENGGQS